VSFFKPAPAPDASPRNSRLHVLIWVLIYAGLLALTLGVVLERTDTELGWTVIGGGGAVATLGFALIYWRSRLTA
jgi:hypothetical protein